jgi:hypothetical protein
MESLGIPGLGPLDASEEGYPDFRISGYTSIGDAGLPQNSTNNILTFDGSLTITPEKHTIQLGAGLQSFQINDNRTDGLRKGRFSFDGYYSGDSFADFLFGVPDAAYRGVGSDRSDLRRKSWYVFARDQWKLDPRFSLSWGLRYNLVPPFHSVRDDISGFVPLLFEPPLNGEIVLAGGGHAGLLGLERAGHGSMVFADRDDWAPSVGLAYRPFGSNRLTIRSSYSLYYSPIGWDLYVNYLGRNYPFFYTESALSPQDKASLVLSNPFESSVATELAVRGIESNISTASVHTWHLGIQNEIMKKWMLEAAFDGSKGSHLPRVMAANIPLPGFGAIQQRRPNPNFGRFTILTGSGSHSRNALNASLERRLADGVSLKSGFSWMSSISDVYYGNPSNPRNLRAERGASDYIPKRQFYLNYILDLPFGRKGRFGTRASHWVDGIIGGWRLSGITRFQDGYPFTVTSAGDPNNDGVPDDRPDRIGPGVLDPGKRTIDAWFATKDFVAPAPYSFGNAGRNILGGPPYVNWDLSVIKQSRVLDSSRIEFRVELFNAFNQVNFELPNSVLGTSVFGKIFGARRAREIELALRYSF